MTQIDFVLIRMLADLSVNTYTNLKFMRGKEYSSDKYNDIELQNINPKQPHGGTGEDGRRSQDGEGLEASMISAPKSKARFSIDDDSS